MKQSIKTAMFAFAVVAAGFGSYKTYSAYNSNHQLSSALLEENLTAMSKGEGGGSSNMLPAHECYTFAAPDSSNHRLGKGYICDNQNFEFSSEVAYKKQTTCSGYEYLGWGGSGGDNLHWCVYAEQN